MKKHLLTIALFFVVIATIFSCKKSPDLPDNQGVENTPSNKYGKFTLVTPPLDWENLDYMPTPPGSTSILVPWASGSNRQIAPEILFDYKEVDGWKLVYNTFSTSTVADKLYFVLYNEYRGLIRMYLYIPSNANLISSSNLVHTLSLVSTAPITSPLLNFSDQNVVDISTNSSLATQMLQWQAAPATWYAFQYELAYDKNITQNTYQSLHLSWPVVFNQLTSIDIDGVQTGTLLGNVTVPATNLTVTANIASISNSIVSGSRIINGSSDVEKIKPSVPKKIYDTLKGLVSKKLSSLTGGIVENLFSGIFGGKSGASEDNVNLKFDSKMKLTGSLSSNFLINPVGISIPGYNQDNIPGFAPAYNKKLGVFYLDNKPTINEVLHKIPQTGPNGEQLVPKDQYVYAADWSTINLVVNPDVLQIATVELIKAEVVVVNTDMYQIDGRLEVIGDMEYKAASNVVTRDMPGGVVGTRLVIQVTPNNGGPKSVIVKTFVSNIVSSVVINPPGQEEN